MTSESQKKLRVSKRRSVAKALSWRIFSSLDTFVIAYIVTGKVTIGATIVGGEFVTKMILYYLHERGWARIRWGLKYHGHN